MSYVFSIIALLASLPAAAFSSANCNLDYRTVSEYGMQSQLPRTFDFSEDGDEWSLKLASVKEPLVGKNVGQFRVRSGYTIRTAVGKLDTYKVAIESMAGDSMGTTTARVRHDWKEGGKDLSASGAYTCETNED